jgi:threonine dehydrogenase-like Zn-dependent dehydrogenase
MSPRAVLVDEPGKVRVVEMSPRPPGPGEALVRVAWAGICGSDLETVAGTRPAQYVRYPITPGHEWSGTVTAAGSGVRSDLVGKKVVGEGFRACLMCAACRGGDTNLCMSGYSETGFTEPGAWADYLTLPARLLHVLPDTADLRSAALLEPAACVAAACLKLAVQPGERVAVVGAGTLGLLATQLLAAVHPGELTVIDRHTHRESLARRCGATYFTTTVDSSETRGHSAASPPVHDGRAQRDDIPAQGNPERHDEDPTRSGDDPLRRPEDPDQPAGELTPSGETVSRDDDSTDHYDAVLEAAGGTSTARLALGLARRGGRVALTGIPATEPDTLSPSDLVLNQLTVHTVFGAPARAWLYAVRAFTGGALDPAPLISREFPLEEVDMALQTLRGGDAVKVLLRL